MREHWKWPWGRHPAPDGRESLRMELEESLRATRLLIAQAYAGFNAAADSELVESYVYEIQALQARYSYLLRQRKALEGTPPATLRQSVCPALPVA